MQPTVSVIMPAFCAAETLDRAVSSVLQQGFADLDLWIIDDASTDATLALAQRWVARDSRVRVIALDHNLGAAGARNRGLTAASGRYIAFLDADDEWLPEKLGLQISAMRETGATLCYTAFWRQRNGARHRVDVPPTVTYQGLLRGNVIGCLTAVVDRSAFAGPLQMPDLRRRQDFAFWLYLLRHGAVAVGLARPLAVYHQTGQSLSSNRFAALRATFSVYHRAEGLSVGKSLALMAQHLVRRLRRG